MISRVCADDQKLPLHGDLAARPRSRASVGQRRLLRRQHAVPAPAERLEQVGGGGKLRALRLDAIELGVQQAAFD